MAKILLIWEMGAGFGHAARLDLLGKDLAANGHDVCVLTYEPKKFSTAHTDTTPCPYNVIQVPAPEKISLRLSRRPANFSEILLSSGYHSTDWLLAAIQEWKTIITAQKIDLAIYDYAPTALLASRDLPFIKLNIGDGFVIPPARETLPCFPNVKDVSDENLKVSDKKLVENVNTVLKQLSISPINYAHDILATQHNILLTTPELDPYACFRTEHDYFPNLTTSSIGKVALNWTSTVNTKRMIGYLKSGYPNLEQLLRYLSKRSIETGMHVGRKLGQELGVEASEPLIEARIFIPDLKDELRNKYQTERLHLSDQAYAMGETFHRADFIVCHGGHSTVLEAINAGIPVLAIPLQVEQFITAQTCIDKHYGRGLTPYDVSNIEKELLIMQHMKITATYQNAIALNRSQRSYQKGINDIVKLIENAITARNVTA